MLQKISCLFFTVVMVSLLGSAPCTADEIQLEMRGKTYADQGSVYLKDIASVRGTTSCGKEKIENIYVADAPEYGCVKTYSRNRILKFVEKNCGAAYEIPYRKTVTLNDIVKVRKEINDLNAEYCRNVSDVLNETSNRHFSTGDPLTREAFAEPFLVQSGDIVNLKLERQCLILTSLGRAEKDGRLGQVIRVRHLQFSSRLEARVTGKGNVEMP